MRLTTSSSSNNFAASRSCSFTAALCIRMCVCVCVCVCVSERERERERERESARARAQTQSLQACYIRTKPLCKHPAHTLYRAPWTPNHPASTASARGRASRAASSRRVRATPAPRAVTLAAATLLRERNTIFPIRKVQGNTMTGLDRPCFFCARLDVHTYMRAYISIHVCVCVCVAR